LLGASSSAAAADLRERTEIGRMAPVFALSERDEDLITRR
jgi:hypothetical protein